MSKYVVVELVNDDLSEYTIITQGDVLVPLVMRLGALGYTFLHEGTSGMWFKRGESNVVIAHRDSLKGAVVKAVDSVKLGDRVRIQGLDG